MFVSDGTLRVIHLVARCQSTTTAAKQSNKVPSAISYTIKRAEESLDVELFIRKGRYIKLSSVESYSIGHSKAILGDLGALKRNTVLIHDGIEYEPTIAVNDIIPGDLLVALVRDLKRQFTSTTLTVDLKVYNGYWDALCSKRADLVYGAPHTIPSNEDIISEPVEQMGWNSIVSPLHLLAAKRHPLENSELRHHPTACIRDTSVDFPPTQIWLSEGQKPIFVPDLITVIALIEQNVDISYTPHHLALPLLNSDKLLKKPMHKRKHATRLFLAVCSDGMGKAYQWCIEYLGDPQLMVQFVFN